MKRLAWDLETDGLLDALTKVHCLVVADLDTDAEPLIFSDSAGYTPLKEGLALLADADLIVGHNTVGYDLQVLAKLYPEWKPRGVSRDTILMARVVWPKDILRDKDFQLQKEGKLPGQMIGRYSLEAFGYRLGNYKGDYSGGWAVFTPEMADYALQDARVTRALYRRLERENWSEESYDLENAVAHIVGRQERRGFAFDQVQATALLATLTQRKLELETALKSAFPPLTIRTPFTPGASNSKLGYVKGVPTTKTRIKEFEPSSRDHIAERLMMLGWVPTMMTEGGKPKVDETVLSGLSHIPEAALVIEYLTVDKRLGQLANGKEAWLRHLGPDGRIHGRVETNGAVTGRMTHSKPNGAQVPSVKVDDDKNHILGYAGGYGHECRALWIAGKGYVLVGCDADALELRCLAHFMARFDDGEYVRTVLEGKKENGTDIHSVNARALGLDPVGVYPIDGKILTGRAIAKTWFYAFIYGAGDEKLGHTVGVRGPITMDRHGKPEDKKAKAAGKRDRARFLTNLPALGKLVAAVKAAANEKKYLTGLDRRKVYVRSDHSALNTLLQSAGALVMKKALVILDNSLQREGLEPGKDYEFVANVHDEWQIEARPQIAHRVGTLAKDAIRQAGDAYSFRCPLAGNYEVGNSWAETH